MRRVRASLSISLLVAAILAAGAAVPASLGAASPGAGAGAAEHEVNRATLAKRAKRVVEKRNRVNLRRVSRCGPRRRGKPESRRWVCEWRAEGTWRGDVPYRCAGDALWNRERTRWRVDRCHNQLQPQAPLLEVPTGLTLGYNDDWIALGKYAPPELLELLEQGGADVARTGLIWWRVEGEPGNYDWLVSDILYERLLDRGMKPLWSILDAPCWAQADPAGCAAGESQIRPDPDHYDELAEFAVAAAKRYPEAVGIEVWNEPNYPKFWGGWPEPDRYAEMLSEVATALHREVPGMPVVSGGLSPHGDTDQKAIGYANFLERLYELGAAQEVDAIGLHPYPGVGPDEDYVADVRVHLGKVQEVMERFSDAETPLWVTEFGVSTGGDRAFDPAAQGRALVDLYELFRRVEGVELAVAHRLVADGGIGLGVDPFGVLDRDLAPKPAYCGLARARGSSPPVCRNLAG